MKCENCGKEHDGSYGSGRFCSVNCKQSWITKISNKSNKRKYEFTCKVCGKIFVAGQGKKLILCNKCRKNRDNQIAINKQNKIHEELRKHTYKCEMCGCEFSYNGVSTRFCSKYCSAKYSSKHVDSKNISNARKLELQRHIQQYDKQPNVCVICGKPIPFNKRSRKTCSIVCQNENRIRLGKIWSQKTKGKNIVGGFRERSSNGKRGWYKGYYCASTYELAFLIWCLDHGKKIVRNTKSYEYEFNGEKHKYYPDWLIDDSFLVETKNFVTDLVLAKAAAVNDMQLIILDKFKMIPYCEYVAKKYHLKYQNFSNDFWKLYDKQDCKI